MSTFFHFPNIPPCKNTVFAYGEAIKKMLFYLLLSSVLLYVQDNALTGPDAIPILIDTILSSGSQTLYK